LVVFAEKELVLREGYDRAQAEQEFEDVGPDSTENGHALQEFDPRLLHSDTSGVGVIMIRCGSVGKKERRIDCRGVEVRQAATGETSRQQAQHSLHRPPPKVGGNEGPNASAFSTSLVG
jgi:hypothetical protein